MRHGFMQEVPSLATGELPQGAGQGWLAPGRRERTAEEFGRFYAAATELVSRTQTR